LSPQFYSVVPGTLEDANPRAVGAHHHDLIVLVAVEVRHEELIAGSQLPVIRPQ